MSACATKGYVNRRVDTVVATERVAREGADSAQVRDIAALRTDLTALRNDLQTLRNEFGARIVDMEPARPSDDTPLDHPRPLTSVQSRHPLRVFDAVGKELQRSGYVVIEKDRSRLLLRAEKAGADADETERVVVWLEQQPWMSSQLVEVYLAYGLFEKRFGRQDVVRVRIDDEQLTARTRVLRARLIAIRGG